MAAQAVRANELVRFERTFNRARLGGAAITFILGPFFPNIGLQHVVLFGTLLLLESALVALLLRSDRFVRYPERVSQAIFAIDLFVVSYAIFLFSYDPNWTTYIVGLLLVIAGGFRFASAGALGASLFMAVTYTLTALYRAQVFGFPTEPQRIAFTDTIYLLAGFPMAGLVRELGTLRAQREAFEHQRAETDALRALDKMKTDFLAEMSHDFRSPLTVVRGAIEILQSQRPGPLTERQQELTARADRNIRRLEEFSEDLLEMARIEHGAIQLERVDVDAGDLVREVVEDHRALANNRGQTIQVDGTPDTAMISADVTRLRRAVGNLVGNAIKFAPEHSTILVRTHRDDGGFSVSVIDHGPGVDRDERERIFEKFSRGRRTSGTLGAGLGLSIARSLAELHGGSIRYEDAVGGGAMFVLTVPVEIE